MAGLLRKLENRGVRTEQREAGEDAPPAASLRMLGSLADAVSAASRAQEMDITMIGLQNAGKTSLLRVLALIMADR
ncbi:MAG: hypothetical protein M1824_006340 [Vezdaea acicularis]|nr:MAG: hypothetical protein M1824_006340 [Vezdaea acicularis]